MPGEDVEILAEQLFRFALGKRALIQTAPFIAEAVDYSDVDIPGHVLTFSSMKRIS